MNQNHFKDHSPTEEPTSGKRRQMLHGMLAIATAAAAGSATLRAFAQTPVAAASTVGSATAAASATDASASLLEHFIAVSQALTARTTLDRDVAVRMLDAVGKAAPAFPEQLRQLAAALVRGTLDAHQEALALRILGGWYMGVVDNQVVTYEQALMFDVVADVLVIRSYCPEKPGFWATPPQEKQS